MGILTSNIAFQFVRFFGIGFLNTAVDFAVLNSLMFYFDVFKGKPVGVFTVISFIIGATHSYFWNKYWAFGAGGDVKDGKFLKSVIQFGSAAALGAVILFAVVAGAAKKFEYSYYIGALIVLFVGEWIMWKAYRLQKIRTGNESQRQFAIFIFVSVVGAIINYAIVRFGTVQIEPQFGISQELWTNVIKAGATGIALIWNFTGYKVFVFKK